MSNTDDGFHPRCSNLQLGEGERTTILTHDQKGPHHHLLKDPEPLGPWGSNINLAPLELVSELGTHNTSCCELSTAEVASRVVDCNYISTSEHEDVCPTCLEGQIFIFPFNLVFHLSIITIHQGDLDQF